MDLVSPSYNIIHIYIYTHTQLILIVWLCMSENRAQKKNRTAPHGGVIFALKIVKNTGIYSVL